MHLPIRLNDQVWIRELEAEVKMTCFRTWEETIKLPHRIATNDLGHSTLGLVSFALNFTSSVPHLSPHLIDRT
jgi:hypothetical protein